MKRQKTRGLGIKLKILIPTIVVILITCFILGLNSYTQISNGMVAMGVEQAEMASAIAVLAVDGDKVKGLMPGDEDTAEYQTVLKALREVQETCGIAYLYTLYTDGSKVYYGIDTDNTIEQCAIGDEFESSYEELKGVFQGEAYVQDYIDETEFGDLISAYCPIYDSQGKVVAILGSDYDAESVVERLNSNVRRVMGTAVLCMVAAVLLLTIIINAISRGLNQVNQKIYDLVHNEGDLTQKLDIHSGDEMELIACNVNALLEYIRNIMRVIAANSVQLNSSSQIVAENLANAEMSISDVSATMEEMSAAMEETNASLNQINEAIYQVNGAVEAIAGSANQGSITSNDVMQQAVQIYQNAVIEQRDAKAQAKRMADSVSDKIERSKAVEEINELTEDIIKITGQTNLLALNASIEAARAGEAGRGFAVVADEIGKLATNSAHAAEEIRRVSAEVVTAVNELAKEAEDMLHFMEETAMGGYEKLLSTSEAYRENVGSMNGMMQEFAAESEQLKENIDNIKDAIESVNIAVEESTRGITNVAEMTVNITSNVADIEGEAQLNMEIADGLNVEVCKFKID